MSHNHNHDDMMDGMSMPMTSKIVPNSGSSSHNDGASMMMSQMAMHLGNIETIVFPEWATKDLKGFIGSCIGLALIGIIFEALKYARSKIASLKRIKLNKMRKQAGSYDISFSDKESQEKPNAGSDLSQNDVNVQIKPAKQKSYLSKMFSFEHIIQTALHFVQYTISFFLMLAFMTFNYWICLSILIGLAIGYFLLGVDRSLNQQFADCCD